MVEDAAPGEEKSRLISKQESGPAPVAAPAAPAADHDDLDIEIDTEDGTIDIDIFDLLPRDNATPCTRFRDKVFFVLGVCNVLLIAYLAGKYPQALPWYYSIKVPLLIGARIILYWRDSWQYFCLDFCYFGNLLLCVYLWFAPTNRELFVVCFAVSHGPLGWAVVLFRNSLVFHSVDKITSAFIHVSPMIVAFCIRWYARGGGPQYQVQFGGGPLSMDRWVVCSWGQPCATMVYSLAIPMGFFLAHELFYFLCIKLICPLPDDPKYLTSYRYLSRQGPVAKIRKLPRCQWPAWVLFNVLVKTLMTVPALLFYYNYWANLVFLVVCFIVTIWNGANFYVEVFSRKYSGWASQPRSKGHAYA